jgi:hypothetical protein
LTTLPIERFEQVWQCVYWYSRRWLIERFHYTLKSGCRIDALQLDKAQQLLNALSPYSLVAWRVMWLTYRARLNPEDTCEVILETAEWRLLRRKFQPKNRSKSPQRSVKRCAGLHNWADFSRVTGMERPE